MEKIKNINHPRKKLIKFWGIIGFFSLVVLLSAKIMQASSMIAGKTGNGFWLICGVVAFLAYLAADFVSGVVHFICDNYGSEHTPLVGEHFIKEFRQHHVDPVDITRYGFVETNGNNCIVAGLSLLVVLILVDGQMIWGFYVQIFMVTFTMLIFGTNQFHKWAHSTLPGRIPLALQRAKLVLGKEHHQIHHKAPYDRYYCITSGILNPLLTKIKFFETILKITGKI